MTHTHRFSVSVAGAVVREDGKVLAIQRRDNKHWEPPGGLLDTGETLRQALVREVREETGYTVTPGRLTGVYQNMARDIVAFVFRCDVAEGTARPTDESLAVAWLKPSEIQDRMDEAFAVRLLDSLNPVQDLPAVRVHDGTNLLVEG